MHQSETKEITIDKKARHLEATLILSTVPTADRIIVIGDGGERVIEPNSNVVTTTISNLDHKVEISKAGYKRAQIQLSGTIKHGDKIQRDAVLEKE